MAEQLKIVIDADVNRAITGINKTGTALNNLTPALQRTQRAANSANTVLQNTGRVFQDLPFGIIGVANNLNPLVESFSAFSRAAKEAGTSVGKQLLGALTGAGGLAFGFSLVTAAMQFAVMGLSAFTRGMGDNKKQVDENKVALDALALSIEAVKDETERLTSAIQFANQLGGINVKVIGFGNIEDLKQQAVAQQQLVVDLQNETLKSQKNYFDAIALNREGATEESKKLEADALNALREAQQKEKEALQTQNIIYARIRLQRVEDDKELQDKLKKLRDAEIKALIDFAKKIEKSGTFNIPVKFQFSDFDTAAQELQKAIKIIGGVQGFTIPIKAPSTMPELPPIDVPILFNGGSQEAFFEEMKRNFQQPFKIDLTIDPAVLAETTRIFNKLHAQQLEAAAATEVLAGAFNTMFDAILAGESPIKAFFNGMIDSINQVIKKLIAAVIQALLLSALSGGKTTFLSAFKGILGFKAQGGPVRSGSPYVVGERGPELFVPNMNGNIIPNNSMSSIGMGLSGRGASSQPIVMDVQITGDAINLIQRRAEKKLSRTG